MQGFCSGRTEGVKMAGRSNSIAKRCRRVRRGIVLALVAACAVLSAGGVSAATSTKAENHCISFGGIDLNEFYGVSEQIVAPRCTQVGSGEQFRPSATWVMNDSFEVVPQEFVPAGATPLEDLIAKFVAVKYVVDPGTAQEKTYVFPNDGNLGIGISRGSVLADALTLATLKPLRVGQHRIDVYWVMSAMHCDGFTDFIPFSCLLAGENRLGRTLVFEVTPGHN
jgi:hypothetical protein